MNNGTLWLTQVLLAHLVSDFLLQPKSWIDSRQSRHFASGKLYLHGAVTGLLAFTAMHFNHWALAAFIMVTHTLIDGIKSYLPPKTRYFLLDQALHIGIICGCWWWLFGNPGYSTKLTALLQQPEFWKTVTGFVFLTSPTGIFIGQLTRQWRDKITQQSGADTESLANAGKWIGFAERCIILVFVLQSQFSAIGLLVAAKGIIRFNEKDRQEIKTEYLVVGTLLSISIAVATGMLLKMTANP